MNEVIKSRRQIIAFIALGLACLFTAGWVRSFQSNDYLKINWNQNSTVLVSSKRSGLKWSYYSGGTSAFSEERKWACEFHSVDQQQRELQVVSNSDPVPDTSLYEFAVGIRHRNRWRFQMSYWQIVFPLMTLAAYLILKKPGNEPLSPSSTRVAASRESRSPGTKFGT